MRPDEIFAPRALAMLVSLAQSHMVADDVQELGVKEALRAIQEALDGRPTGFVILGAAEFLAHRLEDMDEAIREHLSAVKRDVEFFRRVGLLDQRDSGDSWEGPRARAAEVWEERGPPVWGPLASTGIGLYGVPNGHCAVGVGGVVGAACPAAVLL